MAEITPNYPLEWEYKAFEELLGIIQKKWEDDFESFKKLYSINETIFRTLESNKTVTMLPFPYKPKDKDFVGLYEIFLKELVSNDPILFRIYLHNSTLPQDLSIRKYIIEDNSKKHFLPDIELKFLKDLFKKDFLIDSELAKSLSIKGIPLRWFFVGKLFDSLLVDFKNHQLIDKLALEIEKRTGKIESIADLRTNRIKKSKTGIVCDFYPFIKMTITISEVIYEVFNKEDFNNTDDNELSSLADEILCSFMSNAKDDERKGIYFGDSFDTAQVKCLVRYGNEEKEIPVQLLPKYKNLLKAKINEMKKYYEDGEEHQIASIGLMEAAFSYDKNKGKAASWIKRKVDLQFKEDFEEQSTESMQKERHEEHEYTFTEKAERFFSKKIKKSAFDSRGGRLDAPIHDDNDKVIGTLGDNVSKEGLPTRIGDLIIPIENETDRAEAGEIVDFEIEKDQKMKKIMKKKDTEALSVAERKHYERFKKRIINKLQKHFYS